MIRKYNARIQIFYYMKRIILLSIAALLFSATVYCNSAALFTYDEILVNQELSQLQSIENYIAANPGTSLLDIQMGHSLLLTNLNMSNNVCESFASQDVEPPLGISSFIWGCCFGVTGILVVYLVTDDKAETKKALKGCVVSSVVGCVTYVVIYVIAYVYYGTALYYY